MAPRSGCGRGGRCGSTRDLPDASTGPALTALKTDTGAEAMNLEDLPSMNSVENSIHLPPLELPHEREEVGRELQTVLHELIDLSLTGKQLHWAVVGPWSRQLHLFLDELVDSWRDLADTVAERAVALGFVPDGQAAAVSAGSQLSAVRQAALEDHLVVWEMTRRVSDVAERVRARLEPIGNLDLASQDVLIEVVRELEKQQWLLRVQLGERT